MVGAGHVEIAVEEEELVVVEVVVEVVVVTVVETGEELGEVEVLQQVSTDFLLQIQA